MFEVAPGDALVLSPPGLGRVAVREAGMLSMPVAFSRRDRRGDVIGLAVPPAAARRLRTAEDVLVVVGTMRIEHTATATARALRMDEVRRFQRRASGVRLAVRLADESRFTRTALRSALTRRLGSLADDSESADELWVLQTGVRRLHVGIRLTELSKRAGGRLSERHGALRPAVAAAMVFLAGRPELVLDPCCGSGTILSEVAATGGLGIGGDVDSGAIWSASTNTRAGLLGLDARRLPFIDDSFDAVVTNLPFGHQHQLQGTPVAWYRRVLSEAQRVSQTVVVLMPPTQPFRQALGRTNAELVETQNVLVLGRPARIWVLRRR